MISDAFILETRAKVVRELPWPIPATVFLEMTDEDLDRLAVAEGDEYWHILNGIVRRVEVRLFRAPRRSGRGPDAGS